MKSIKLKKSFDKNKTSEDQYRWLIANHKGITLILDNDHTFIDFGNDDDGESVTSDFIDHIGCTYGVQSLLGAIGINSEMC